MVMNFNMAVIHINLNQLSLAYQIHITNFINWRFKFSSHTHVNHTIFNTEQKPLLTIAVLELLTQKHIYGNVYVVIKTPK